MRRVLALFNLVPNKFGSLEEHILFLCRELSSRGTGIVVGFIEEPFPEYRDLLISAGAEIIVFSSENVTTLAGLTSMSGLVKKRQIGLVHLNMLGVADPSLLSMYLTDARIVFTEHGSGGEDSSRRWHPLRALIDLFILPRISLFIGVSRYVSDRLQSLCNLQDHRVKTVYNGVNCDRFKPDDPHLARLKIEIPVERTVVVAVAMLIQEKGIHYLLQAAALLVHQYGRRDLLVLIAGEGPCRTELEGLAQDLSLAEHVRFIGRRSDVEVVLAAADLVVVPSVWQEAFGFIVAEAMASGRVVVASRVGGIPEIVEDGVTGILVPRRDSEALAVAINKVLSDPVGRAEMAAAAIRRARQHFEMNCKIKEVVAVYDEFINRG